ncbi:TPA: ABC transporter permease [Stenotrophomonas maltophilia]|jgi:sodium transport system permease protein|uniref:ABC transporter permease n=1 Tax=Stenotrophomonas maltophilia TaxID=40324 RepID=UPI0013102512|nr:ABC transporter permease [Stenotrophomonas maltophilia]MBA0284779.1 ABC transporter permease [Stenotrophomonas maltophilia]MBA0325669.1 ABC transporter permease [Stenotrophomonas maltophilia]HDS1131268.1 ABC transporter permease [Stenotrophomonas maltophilia]HDS1156261.1 ABC transporter permease [Stenotrophomonas maltophilia]HDS1167966.1 ABC transporter permease [Stenotrophomonas maltophilia]
MSMMSTLMTVMRKELRDLSRDRRTLLLTLLFGPLLYPVLLLGMGKLAESRVRTQIEQPLQIPTIGAENAPNLVRFLAAQGLNTAPAPKDLPDAIRSQEIDVALRISDDFGKDWADGKPALVEVIKDSTRRAAEVPSARLEAALATYNGQVGALRLMARGIDAQVARPLDVARQDLASAEAKRGMILSMLLPVLLTLTSFIGGAYLVMDATAGERERQSLEPLLATPGSRSAIVSGKIAAACVVGFVSLLLTLVAFKVSAQIAPGNIGRQFNMNVASMLQMLLVMLPMLMIGTSLLTFLSAAAKSMKEAQSHMTWLMLLPMMPGYALVAYPLKSELWQYAVPFLSQNQMLLKVIRHETITPTIWAIYLGASLGLAALLWFAAVRRYHNERLAISG